MAESMNDIMHPRHEKDKNAAFPHAPEEWSEEHAQSIAAADGLELEEAHWAVIRFLQDYFSHNESSAARQLTKALEEQFQQQGGRKYLYNLFPKGPANQGSRIAGLKPPEGSADQSFGSVQ
jgi:tRNA 2-thiouridine synthesizing protein E